MRKEPDLRDKIRHFEKEIADLLAKAKGATGANAKIHHDLIKKKERAKQDFIFSNRRSGAFNADEIETARQAQQLTLSIKQNAVHSIEHGMEHFIESKEKGSCYGVKFALLHVFHGAELLLKYRLACVHDILVFSDIDRKVGEGSHTVGVAKALKRLRNCGIEIDKGTENLILKMQGWRNAIEHYEMNLELGPAENILGGVLKFLLRFIADEFDDEKTRPEFSAEILKAIDSTIYTYDERLSAAEKRRDDALQSSCGSQKDGFYREEIICPSCEHDTCTHEDDERIYCHFCAEGFDLIKCPRCGNSFPEGGFDGNDFCSDCIGYYNYVMDRD